MTRLLVGSFTEPYGPFRAAGDGLSLVELAPDGALVLRDRLALRNPAYVRLDPSHRLAYVALEVDDDGTAIVVASLDPFRVVGRTALPGAVLCHLDLHPGGAWIAGVCYGSGHVHTRRIGPDGVPVPDSGTTLPRAGSSVHPVRQTSAHPHAARFSPDGRWLIVPDLGTDEVVCYPFDSRTGSLGPPCPLPQPPGCGPRLGLFDRSGRHFVLVEELASAVSVFAWDNGTLRLVERYSALPVGFAGANTTAGLRWHPSGEMFAVSNRGLNQIVLFDYDAADGRTRLRDTIPSGGAKPRDFDFTPCGRWLVVGNQDGDSLRVVAVTSRLDETGHGLELASPSCVRAIGW